MKKKKKQLFQELAEKHRGSGCSPRCAHFDKCGGCLFQDIPYDGQLALKKEYLDSLFNGLFDTGPVHPAEPFQYRNRMDMVTAFGKIGLREAGSYKFVVDVESCEIMQEKSNALYQMARPLIKEIEDYNYLKHQGYLRYIVLRQARFTGQSMVNFVVASRENRLEPLLDALQEQADSMSLLLSDGLADLSYGEVIKDMKGGHITEEFDGIKYRITPNSFFQSNSEIALLMYRRIKEMAQGRVLDLYCGLGSISLFVADKAESVLGVEQVSEAVDSARVNQADNSIENVSFQCADARIYMRDCEEYFDTVILDPPRSGMNPRILKYLNRMAPERIVYMSCNPAMFRQEVEALEEYRVESFEAYDMFPQTPHVEALALLVRK